MTIRFFPSKVIFADKLHHVSAEIRQSIRGGLYYLWLLHVGVKSVTRLARKIKLVCSCFTELPAIRTWLVTLTIVNVWSKILSNSLYEGNIPFNETAQSKIR